MGSRGAISTAAKIEEDIKTPWNNRNNVCPASCRTGKKPKNSSMSDSNTSIPVVTFDGSPFRLHQPFPPAGDQPEAIRLLVEGIDDGLSFQTLLGVTGS